MQFSHARTALAVAAVSSMLATLAFGWSVAVLLWGVVVVAAIGSVLTSRRLTRSERGLVALFASVNLLWLLSDAVRVFAAPAALEPLGEVLANAGLVLLGVVIVWVVRLRGRPRGETWLDGMLFSLAVIPPLWLSVIVPALDDAAALPWVAVWAVLTVGVLGLGGLYLLSGGVWNVPATLLAVGVVLNIGVTVGCHVADPVAVAQVPRFGAGYVLWVLVALHPQLLTALRKGGRPDGVPLLGRVWMLIPTVALPLMTLEWSFVQGEDVPTLAIGGSLAGITLIVGLRSLLMARAGIRDWAVPQTISVAALLVAAAAVSLTLLSQSAREAQERSQQLARVLPELAELDSFLLRSISPNPEQAAASRASWLGAVRDFRAAGVAPASAFDEYSRQFRLVTAAADQKDGARVTQMIDHPLRAAHERVVGHVLQRVDAAQLTADDRARTVRLFTVAMLTLTLFLVSALLLRFNLARKRIELQHQETHDGLTGLPNRVALERQLRERVDAPEGEGGRSLVLLDLDDFKAINDASGRAVGDAVLKMVSVRLEVSTRRDELLVRTEGNAFAVLLPAGEDPVELADRLLAALAAPVDIDGVPHRIAGSVGIAGVPEDDADRSGSAFRDAELAMYQAKLSAGNSVELFTGDMHERVRDRIQLTAELREAIEHGGLHLVYQPIVGAADGRVVGYEALVRWRHPDRGPLSPAEFIPVAERSGLIVELGGWVLETAAAQLAEWQARWGDERYVSVNVAAAQFTSRVIERQVSAALDASGLAPELLLLEVTESSLIEDLDASVAQMHAIRELGVRFALDDFGTGYSSLSYLRQFPVDVLKIDKSFIDALFEPDGTLLVEAIVNMASGLGLRVVAEGIEQLPQVEALRELGCELAQGYLFSRPMPVADVAANQLVFGAPAGPSLRRVS